MRHVGLGTIASLFALRCAAHPIHPAGSAAARNSNAALRAGVTPSEATPPSGEVPQRAELRALLCPRDAKCCFEEARHAGIDRHGRNLTLVSVRPCTWEEGAAGEGALDLSEEESSAYCEDHWLVAKAAGGKPDTRWLGQDCTNDRTEVSTSIDLRTRTFSHGVRSLFSNEQSARSVTVNLDSAGVVRLDSGVQSMTHRRDFSWNFEGFTGAVELALDYCSAEQRASATAARDQDAPSVEVSAVAVPRVVLPRAFLEGGWRSRGLGRCAARIDGAERGFTLQGKTEGAREPYLRVVLSLADDLFVEVEDEDLVLLDESSQRGGRLEVWTAAPARCIDTAATSPLQHWTIRVIDGQVLAPHGRPAPVPTVEIARAARGVRLRVGLGALRVKTDRLTIAYADTDGLGRPARVIATSPFEPDKWWTLGEPFELSGVEGVPGAQLACDIDGASLAPRAVLLPERAP
jgi:hypothetical protein